MGTITVLAFVIGGLYFVARTIRRFKQYRAALNALMAKSVFEKLSPEEQEAVIARSHAILQSGWNLDWVNLESMDPRRRYGFYALAMAELGISPPDKRLGWNLVRNPFLVLLNAEKQIEVARLSLHKRGIEVSLIDEPFAPPVLSAPSIDTSKPATDRRVKTGHRGRGVETALLLPHALRAEQVGG